MSPNILVILPIAIGLCASGYWAYRAYKQRQARQKRRDQFKHRV